MSFEIIDIECNSWVKNIYKLNKGTRYGRNISLSEKGDVMAITYENSEDSILDTDDMFNGTVIIYKYSKKYSKWQSFGNPICKPDDSGEDFGYKISLSCDGLYIAISSIQYCNKIGKVYLYKFNKILKDWIRIDNNQLKGQTNKIISQDNINLYDGDKFGINIDLKGSENNYNLAILSYIGIDEAKITNKHGKIHLYSISNKNITKIELDIKSNSIDLIEEDCTDFNISLSNNASKFIIGVPKSEKFLFTYVKNNNIYIKNAPIKKNNLNDIAGYSIKISRDGNYICFPYKTDKNECYVYTIKKNILDLGKNSITFDVFYNYDNELFFNQFNNINSRIKLIDSPLLYDKTNEIINDFSKIKINISTNYTHNELYISVSEPYISTMSLNENGIIKTFSYDFINKKWNLIGCPISEYIYLNDKHISSFTKGEYGISMGLSENAKILAIGSINHQGLKGIVNVYRNASNGNQVNLEKGDMFSVKMKLNNKIFPYPDYNNFYNNIPTIERKLRLIYDKKKYLISSNAKYLSHKQSTNKNKSNMLIFDFIIDDPNIFVASNSLKLYDFNGQTIINTNYDKNNTKYISSIRDNEGELIDLVIDRKKNIEIYTPTIFYGPEINSWIENKSVNKLVGNTIASNDNLTKLVTINNSKLYIYHYINQNSTWEIQNYEYINQKHLVPELIKNSEIKHVAMSQNGNNIAISSPIFKNNLNGNVQIFHYSEYTTQWQLFYYHEVPHFQEPLENYSWTNSLAIANNKTTILGIYNDNESTSIGKIKIIVPYASSFKCVEFTHYNDKLFGKSVDISCDGKWAVATSTIGNNDNTGIINFYEINNNVTINFLPQILGFKNDRIGESVSITQTNSNINTNEKYRFNNYYTAISSKYNYQGRGSVKVFVLYKNKVGNLGDVNKWYQIGQTIIGKNNTDFSISGEIKLSGNAQTLAISYPKAYNGNLNCIGIIEIYRYNSDLNLWLKIGNQLSGNSFTKLFGKSLCISSDGNSIIVSNTVNQNKDIIEDTLDSGKISLYKFTINLKNLDIILKYNKSLITHDNGSILKITGDQTRKDIIVSNFYNDFDRHQLKFFYKYDKYYHNLSKLKIYVDVYKKIKDNKGIFIKNPYNINNYKLIEDEYGNKFNTYSDLKLINIVANKFIKFSNELNVKSTLSCLSKNGKVLLICENTFNTGKNNSIIRLYNFYNELWIDMGQNILLDYVVLNIKLQENGLSFILRSSNKFVYYFLKDNIWEEKVIFNDFYSLFGAIDISNNYIATYTYITDPCDQKNFEDQILVVKNIKNDTILFEKSIYSKDANNFNIDDICISIKISGDGNTISYLNSNGKVSILKFVNNQWEKIKINYLIGNELTNLSYFSNKFVSEMDMFLNIVELSYDGSTFAIIPPRRNKIIFFKYNTKKNCFDSCENCITVKSFMRILEFKMTSDANTIVSLIEEEINSYFDVRIFEKNNKKWIPKDHKIKTYFNSLAIEKIHLNNFNSLICISDNKDKLTILSDKLRTYKYRKNNFEANDIVNINIIFNKRLKNIEAIVNKPSIFLKKIKKYIDSRNNTTSESYDIINNSIMDFVSSDSKDLFFNGNILTFEFKVKKDLNIEKVFLDINRHTFQPISSELGNIQSNIEIKDIFNKSISFKTPLKILKTSVNTWIKYGNKINSNLPELIKDNRPCLKSNIAKFISLSGDGKHICVIQNESFYANNINKDASLINNNQLFHKIYIFRINCWQKWVIQGEPINVLLKPDINNNFYREFNAKLNYNGNKLVLSRFDNKFIDKSGENIYDANLIIYNYNVSSNKWENEYKFFLNKNYHLKSTFTDEQNLIFIDKFGYNLNFSDNGKIILAGIGKTNKYSDDIMNINLLIVYRDNYNKYNNYPLLDQVDKNIITGFSISRNANRLIISSMSANIHSNGDYDLNLLPFTTNNLPYFSLYNWNNSKYILNKKIHLNYKYATNLYPVLSGNGSFFSMCIFSKKNKKDVESVIELYKIKNNLQLTKFTKNISISHKDINYYPIPCIRISNNGNKICIVKSKKTKGLFDVVIYTIYNGSFMLEKKFRNIYKDYKKLKGGFTDIISLSSSGNVLAISNDRNDNIIYDCLSEINIYENKDRINVGDQLEISCKFNRSFLKIDSYKNILLCINNQRDVINLDGLNECGNECANNSYTLTFVKMINNNNTVTSLPKNTISLMESNDISSNEFELCDYQGKKIEILNEHTEMINDINGNLKLAYLKKNNVQIKKFIKSLSKSSNFIPFPDIFNYKNISKMNKDKIKKKILEIYNKNGYKEWNVELIIYKDSMHETININKTKNILEINNNFSKKIKFEDRINYGTAQSTKTHYFILHLTKDLSKEMLKSYLDENQGIIGLCKNMYFKENSKENNINFEPIIDLNIHKHIIKLNHSITDENKIILKNLIINLFTSRQIYLNITNVSILNKSKIIEIDIPNNDVIYFLGNALLNTDQGKVRFDMLTTKNSINGKRILSIAKFINTDKYMILFKKDSLQKNVPSLDTIVSKSYGIYMKSRIHKSCTLINQKTIIKKYINSRKIIYNVLLEKSCKMIVNNIVVESINPLNKYARNFFKKQKENERKILIKNEVKRINQYKKSIQNLF